MTTEPRPAEVLRAHAEQEYAGELAALAAEAPAGWPTDDARAALWARAVERFTDLLTFRRELTEAFDR